jgi:hypothetical protein
MTGAIGLMGNPSCSKWFRAAKLKAEIRTEGDQPNSYPGLTVI